MATNSVKLVDRFRGAMIGGLVGDCLGANFEMMHENLVPLDDIDKFFSEEVKMMKEDSEDKFQYTDDTAMARQIGKHIISTECQLDSKILARDFTTEYYREPWRGYGGSVVEVFSKLRASDYVEPFKPAREQFNGSGSYGNGAGMRAHPIGLSCHGLEMDDVVERASQVARLTHAHHLGVHGGVLQTAAVYLAVRGLGYREILENLVELVNKLEKDNNDDSGSTYKAKMGLVSESLDKPDDDLAEIVFDLGNDVSAVDSVPTALFCFLKVAKDQGNDGKDMFEKVLRLAIRVGGDTDTIASMACAITGAYLGIQDIPTHLYACCEAVEEIDQIGRQLYQVSLSANKISDKDSQMFNKDNSQTQDEDQQPKSKKIKEDF